MSILDWAILIATLTFIIGYGYWKTRGRQDMDSYLRGGGDVKWWAVGLSVMATQASAITFMSTPGQAFHDGLGFVQFYFGLPLAMIVIAITFIPIFHKLKVYTAYEYLEQRFDYKTRGLTALLFLIQRGMAAGITIYAPAIILSTILGWDLHLLNILLGGLVIIYTVAGGTDAVNVTQKQQMFVIMGGMFFTFWYIITLFPEGISFVDAMEISAAGDKMKIIDYSLDPSSRYTIWSGLTGGFFLALAYFGTDQSQVQRYLSGKSVRISTLGLMFNAILKIPMQFLILLTGVLVFVFYQFNSSPVFFNQSVLNKLNNTEAKAEIMLLQAKKDSITLQKSAILKEIYSENLPLENGDEKKLQIKELMQEEKAIMSATKEIISTSNPDAETNDKDYVFISFILEHLPQGLIGLLLAVIFCAAMSSTAAELNALAATTTVDFYKRKWADNRQEDHYVKSTKVFTLIWGLIAIAFASIGTLFENLIQLVNIVGSVFYGTILGIFLTGFYFKRVGGNAVFTGAVIAEAIVLFTFFFTETGYLWLNLIGCVCVILFSSIIQMMRPFGIKTRSAD